MKKEEAVELPKELEQDRGIIEEWLEYKRERGQKYKKLGLKALFARIRGIPEAYRKVSIEHSMANNWSGIFEVKGGSRHDKADNAIPGKYAGVTHKRGTGSQQAEVGGDGSGHP